MGLRGRAGRDAAWVLGGVAGFAALSVQWELAERLGQWSHTQEALQADEFSLTLVLLALGLAWFAFRRLHEARQALHQQARAEQQVAELLQHNRELTQRLMTAQEDERRALARELHDEIGQTCTALRIEAAWVLHAPASDWAAVQAAAQRIAQQSAHMHGMARDMLKRLRPPNLDELGLPGALHALCEGWQSQHGVACTLHCAATVALPDTHAVHLYRVVQEALNNIAQHAQASAVQVHLSPSPGPGWQLRVQDNGRGLPTPKPPSAGLGMLGMRERVAALGGQIRWSAAQPGTCVTVQLPAPEGAA